MEKGVREGEDTCGVTCCAHKVFLNDNYDFLCLLIHDFWFSNLVLLALQWFLLTLIRRSIRIPKFLSSVRFRKLKVAMTHLFCRLSIWTVYGGWRSSDQLIKPFVGG